MKKIPNELPSIWIKGVPAIARHAGVSQRTVSNWIASKALRVRKLNSRLTLVRRVDVDEFIENQAADFEEEGNA